LDSDKLGTRYKQHAQLLFIQLNKNLHICYMDKCKKCNAELQGKFCANCGQKVISTRYTVKESVGWVFGSIFNLDHGFFYTSKLMLTKPGKVVNDFMNGVTVGYSHPFRFLFFWATISAIIGAYFGAFEESGLVFNKMAGQSEEEIARARKVMLFMKQYMSFIIMAFVPFSALGSYLVLKPKKLNYAEHLILNSYSTGISTAIGLPIVFAYAFTDNFNILSLLSFALGFLIIGRVYAKTFDDHYFVGVLRYLGSFLIGFATLMIFIFVIAIVLAIASKSMGLDLFEGLKAQ